MTRTLLLGLAAAVLPILPAAAGPATPEEAARLTSLFERYVGQPAPGQPGSVTVVPQGESYVATLDLKRALAGLEGLGFTLDPIVSTETLTPLPDGTWRVTAADSPPITLHVGPQTYTFTSATSAFDGIYDPKIDGFSRSHQEQTGIAAVQTSPTMVQDRRTDRLALDLAAKPAPGGSDVEIHEGFSGTKATFTFVPPAAAAAASPPPVGPYGYAAPTGTVDIGLDGLRNAEVLDLWAFLVAHPSRDSLAAAQDGLKALLRAGLPYVQALKQGASFASFSATTPIGLVTAKTAAAGLEASGLAGTGKASFGVTLAGLVVPPGQFPPSWSGLLPTDVDLHLGAEGFHATEAATELVGDVDLKKDVVVTTDQKAAAAHLFWPGGGTVTLQPSHIATGMLDLKMQGRASLGDAPGGTVTLSGRGLDAEIAALQAQAVTDPGASQILGPLVLAKNLAKPEADGSLTWVVAFGSGPVTVNGAVLQ